MYIVVVVKRNRTTVVYLALVRDMASFFEDASTSVHTCVIEVTPALNKYSPTKTCNYTQLLVL
jgi:hypothetical protein